MQKRNFISVKVAVERIGCGHTHFYKLLGECKIVAYKMGGRTMVDADSVELFVASLPRFESRARRGKR